MSRSQDSRVAAVREAASHGVDLEIVRGELADAAVLPGADGVLQACVDSVGGVDVGELAAPAVGAHGQVGDPQGVLPSVLSLEQGELGAWWRALA